MQLQAVIYDALRPEEKNFIVPKKPTQFEKMLTHTGRMLGIFSRGSSQNWLVGYGGIAFPHQGWPTADMIVPPTEIRTNPTQMAVLQNMVVHPNFRGQGIQQEMIRASLEICNDQGRNHVYAEIAVPNIASLKSFISTGFYVTLSDIDPVDACPLLYAYRDLRREGLGFVKATSTINPMQDFTEAQRLLSSGYHGFSVKRLEGSNYLMQFRKVCYDPRP